MILNVNVNVNESMRVEHIQMMLYHIFNYKTSLEENVQFVALVGVMGVMCLVYVRAIYTIAFNQRPIFVPKNYCEDTVCV